MGLRGCFPFFIVLIHVLPAAAQQVAAIGFWNVENFYDTLNDKWKNDEEFTPDGVNGWNGERYRLKVDRLGEVIGKMATAVTPHGLSLLGVCEVENKGVLGDLVRSPRLQGRNYQFVHIEGPDIRGVDVALIYNPSYFKVQEALAYPVKMVTDSLYRTRDILVVSGQFLGEPLAVLVNHSPSRRGGELLTRPNRVSAARVARKIADSISVSNPNMKIIIMGDLNDDPTSESVKKHIHTCGDAEQVIPGVYFNPMEKPYKDGIGSLAWADSWNLFDQVLLNHAWLDSGNSWHYRAVRVFNEPFLRSDYGNFKGYPFRTYAGGTYAGGYSDHFPVYIIIERNTVKPAMTGKHK